MEELNCYTNLATAVIKQAVEDGREFQRVVYYLHKDNQILPHKNSLHGLKSGHEFIVSDQLDYYVRFMGLNVEPSYIRMKYLEEEVCGMTWEEARKKLTAIVCLDCMCRTNCSNPEKRMDFGDSKPCHYKRTLPKSRVNRESQKI